MARSGAQRAGPEKVTAAGNEPGPVPDRALRLAVIAVMVSIALQRWG